MPSGQVSPPSAQISQLIPLSQGGGSSSHPGGCSPPTQLSQSVHGLLQSGFFVQVSHDSMSNMLQVSDPMNTSTLLPAPSETVQHPKQSHPLGTRHSVMHWGI